MKLLVLGGTADGRKIVEALDSIGLLQTYSQATNKIELIYSIAGLTSPPALACQVISGGFSQYGGLANYIKHHGIEAVLDATHPFAKNISRMAVQAAAIQKIPCWRFLRPEWQAQTGDRWQFCKSINKVFPVLTDYSSIFFTVGQLGQDFVQQLSQQQKNGQKIRVRTGLKPEFKFPTKIEWLQGMGAFNTEDESKLLQQLRVDLLVTKNSGGEDVVAKLIAARELGINVLLIERPELEAVEQQFYKLQDCINWLQYWLDKQVTD